MALLPASEAASFFETLLPFFISESLWPFLLVHVHGIEVVSRGISWRGWGVEGNGGPGGMLFCDHGCKLLLTEELVDFLISSFGCGWDYLHATNSV